MTGYRASTDMVSITVRPEDAIERPAVLSVVLSATSGGTRLSSSR